MLQSNILRLARQGQPDAITYALNYVLQTLAVTGRAIIEAENIIFIIQKSDGTPPRAPIEKYIKNFLLHLKIPLIRQVEIYAKDTPTQSLQWFSQFSIESLNSKPSNVGSSQSTEQSTSFPSAAAYATGNAPAGPDDTTTRTTPDANTPWNTPAAATDVQTPDPVDFEQLPQDLQQRIKAAGLRAGETRSWQEAQKMYNKIPKNVCRLGAKGISQYKQNHDWSHKKSHAHGGSNKASNGDWEASSVNRARGQKNITPTEQQNIAKAKAKINFQAGTKVVATQAVKAGKSALGFELAFSGLNNFVAVQQGQKSVEDALVDTLKASATAAATTTVVTGGIVAISIVFPPAGAAFATAAPVLKIVGKVNCLKRVIGILSESDKVEGADQIQALMDSYGLDEKELIYRDLEMDDDLAKLKLDMGMA
ncbi:hypothetical protein [Acaryochloris marina]|uniref:hypothetical protein n=1 Tax=Acaryochloris marina TaxID=155978 RepID=UPI0021C3E065|nr:hypothetical protein [Acaryochloris marina]BDM78105.1 hypothetical protein AM10699_09750 [Acaryochloris marina MBIC10699]